MDSREVTLQWNQPENVSGYITGYIVNYSGSRENRMMHALQQAILLADSARQYQVRDLLPLYKYIFEVRND